MESRFRLHKMYEEFANPLYEMTYIATKDVWRISTDGINIYFDPDWLQKLGDIELDFIIMHEFMHINLGHIYRPAYYRGDRYHLAADIVVNGKLTELGWKYGELKGIGKIRAVTIFPEKIGKDITSVEAVKCVPIDPSTMDKYDKRTFMIDSDEWWEKRDEEILGTVVLSPLDAEPVNLEYYGPTYGGYFKFPPEWKKGGKGYDDDNDCNRCTETDDEYDPTGTTRKHSKSLEVINQLRRKMKYDGAGDKDRYDGRMLDETKAKELDWRTILDSFVQEDVNDYSFMPPDRRLQDMECFLPEYNVADDTPKNVAFLVDTSGSVSNEKLGLAFDEIKQAIEQFGGILNGIIAFFDTELHMVMPFSNVNDVTRLKPKGGGGTDYHRAFSGILNKTFSDSISSIVVITDGMGEYPDESIVKGRPVLWLMTTNECAPWGKSISIIR